MYRTFWMNDKTGRKVWVSETDEPKSVKIGIDDTVAVLSEDQFSELASLARYSTYGDSINYTPKKDEDC